MNVYLAGPVSGLSYKEATEWRKTWSEELEPIGINCLDPMAGISEEDFKAYEDDCYRGGLLSEEAVTARDYLYLSRSRLIVMNTLQTPTISVGCAIETGWARALDIPMLWLERDPWDHAMLNVQKDFIATSHDYGINMVIDILLPGGLSVE